nr:MAG TPA: hypothetical protein [Bacteriophage sp.]
MSSSVSVDRSNRSSNRDTSGMSLSFLLVSR